MPDNPTPDLNPLYAARQELLARGGTITDLVAGNPTRHGMVFPADRLREILQAAALEAQVYRPDPLGQPAAREAIARYYGEAGCPIPPERILLTPGTSLSYFYLFRFLAEDASRAPGTPAAPIEILCPQPSYPLFETIAEVAGVRLAGYRLREERRWAIDLEHLESRVTTRTRGLVLISPHNPTGRVSGEEEVAGLAAVAARHRLAILADEVFGEFLFQPGPLARPAATAAPLVFTLNGFSKMLALPGMKLGWIAVSGEPGWVQRALWKLELISDTFLPVNEIVQCATPDLLREGESFLPGYRAWVKERRELAVERLRRVPGVDFVPPAGGFYLTLQVRGEGVEEEALAVDLLREAKVLVHPGFFYDIPGTHLVLTFVEERDALAAALDRLATRLAALP